MATGWADDGAVQDQIDATVKDGIKRVRSEPASQSSPTLRARCLLLSARQDRGQA